MISYKVIVKEGVTLDQGTVASRYTYDSDESKFVKGETNTTFFEEGMISYLPRECLLKDYEQLGGQPFKEEEESDLEDADDYDDEDTQKEAFNNEIRKAIVRCASQNFPINNLVMEIKSLKMSDNMKYSDCVEAVIPPLLDLTNQDSVEGTQLVALLQSTLNKWKSIIKDFVFDKEDSFTLIRATEIYCAKHAKFNSAFHIIMQLYFKLEVLTEEQIIAWNDNAVESLKTVDQDEELRDDIFDEVEPKMREKFIQNVRFG